MVEVIKFEYITKSDFLELLGHFIVEKSFKIPKLQLDFSTLYKNGWLEVITKLQNAKHTIRTITNTILDFPKLSNGLEQIDLIFLRENA